MKLDSRHDRAALRLAEGRWIDERIAKEAGISRVALWKWLHVPEFAALVEQQRSLLHGGVIKRGIADKQTRIDGQVDRHQRLQEVIEQRAARGQALLAEQASGLTPGGLPVPEGRKPIPAELATGMVVRQEKVTPFGSVAEFVVDAGTSAEMRALEKQVAQELGEWTEKRELSGKDGGPVQIDLTGLSDEELALAAALRRKLAPSPGGD